MYIIMHNFPDVINQSPLIHCHSLDHRQYMNYITKQIAGMQAHKLSVHLSKSNS